MRKIKVLVQECAHNGDLGNAERTLADGGFKVISSCLSGEDDERGYIVVLTDDLDALLSLCHADGLLKPISEIVD